MPANRVKSGHRHAKPVRNPRNLRETGVSHKHTANILKSKSHKSSKKRKVYRTLKPITTIHLPSHLDQVKMIAKQGLTDKEMAAQFGVPDELFSKWLKAYPSFQEAIKEGRSDPDAEVVKALYKRATGMKITESQSHEKVLKSGKKIKVKRSQTRTLPPDPDSIKFWLTNRKKAEWKNRHSADVEQKALIVVAERKQLIDDIYKELLADNSAMKVIEGEVSKSN